MWWREGKEVQHEASTTNAGKNWHLVRRAPHLVSGYSQHEVKEFWDDKLDHSDSTLVILIANPDWEAGQSEGDHFGGETQVIEPLAEAEKRLAEITAEGEVVDTGHVKVEIDKGTL